MPSNGCRGNRQSIGRELPRQLPDVQCFESSAVTMVHTISKPWAGDARTSTKP